MKLGAGAKRKALPNVASGGAESPAPAPSPPPHHHCLKGTNMETQKFVYLRSQKNYFLRMSFSFSSFYYSEVIESRGFPGGPVIRAPDFHCRGHRFDPWSEN